MGAPATAPPPPPPPLQLRRYRPDTSDLAHLTDICRGVYGGHDTLPRTLDAAAAEPGAAVLCLADDADDALHALVIMQPRGGGAPAWLSSLRVRASMRGRGLAGRLLDAGEAAARAAPEGVKSLMTATLDSNAPVVSALARRGWARQAEVDVWPTGEARAGAATLRAAAPGLDALLAGGAGAALARAWHPCASAEELEALLLTLRRGRVEARRRGGDANGVAADDAALHTWLPAFYDVLPARMALAEGRVWTLDAPAGSGAGRHRAALVLAAGGGLGGGRRVAGVAADSAAGVEAAVAKVMAEDLECLSLCIDACGRPAHAALLALGGARDPSATFLVLDKLLRGTGAGGTGAGGAANL
jgi:GNAT superfamily N-acetyltransferase